MAKTPPDADGRRRIWHYGVNDHIDELPIDRVKEFKAQGSFRSDFGGLCSACGVVPHPGFLPPVVAGRSESKKGAKDVAAETTSPVLALQSVLVDRAAMMVFKHVIATSLHIEVLRLTSCCLEVEMLGLLRAGLVETCSVAILQLDWNPVEVPLDVQELKPLAEQKRREEIDALEQARERRQAERTLRAFGEMLAARFGDIPTALKALQRVAIADRLHHEATAGVEPFALSVWADAFHAALNLGIVEAEVIFGLLDGPFFGNGDGLLSFLSLGDVLQSLPALSPEEEAADPVGNAFAAFMDSSSPLDVVSFRHCSLGYLEALALGRSLRTSHTLRALNLWGNSICDRGAAAIAESFDAYYGLQFLGLGRNLITHVGLEALCDPLGYSRVDDKAQADQVTKEIKEKSKDLEKRKKNPPVPKKDVRGCDRYVPEFALASIEQQMDGNTGEQYWLWGRNMCLRTLNLEHNPIADAEAVMKIQPWGVGELHLRGVSCAAELAELQAQGAKAPQEGEPGDPPGSAGAKEKPGSAKGGKREGGPSAAMPGWTLILQ